MSAIEKLCKEIDDEPNLMYEMTEAFYSHFCQEQECSHNPPPALIIRKAGLEVRFTLTAEEFPTQAGTIVMFDLTPIESSEVVKNIDKDFRARERLFGRDAGCGPSFYEIFGDTENIKLLSMATGIYIDENLLAMSLQQRICAYLEEFEQEMASHASGLNDNELHSAATKPVDPLPEAEG